MPINLNEFEVIHIPERARFELTINGEMAELEYHVIKDTMVFTHTLVPTALEGQGVGNKLVKTGLDYARESGMKIRSTCWFVSLYLKRHPEYLK